ncbi:MAG TPA: hypothetical protein VF407_08565, partial [Polyangiaceae bacterium]
MQKKRGRALALGCAALTALVLCSSSALAQKKKKGGAAPAPSASAGASGGGDIELDDSGGAKPADPNAAAGQAAGAGGDIELDQPNPNAGQTTPPAGGDTGATGGVGGGICDIDPSACPKPEDIKAAANKQINAEVYAVQQVYVLRARRIEISPYWAFGLNDQFVSHTGPGLSANYYISQVLAFGINGTYYGGLNGDSDFNFQNRREARIAVPLNEYLVQANVNFTYVPFYGKFAAFNDFIF